MIPKRRKINIAETRYAIKSVVELYKNEKTTKSAFSYDLDLKYIGGGIFKKWDKSNFRINGLATFSKIDEVYLKVSQPVNKLDFFYENGEITKLINHKSILDEWETVKDTLNEEFYGEVINELVEKTTENLNDLKQLKRILSRDLVLQHLYSSSALNDSLIYLKSSKNKRTYLGLLETIPLHFQERKTFASHEDHLEISTESNLVLEKTNHEGITNYFKPVIDDFDINDLQSTIQSQLTIDPESLWINSASIEHVINVENSDYKKTITLTIKKIEDEREY